MTSLFFPPSNLRTRYPPACRLGIESRRSHAIDARIDALNKHRYISLTTYKRDGRAIATPVWFVPDGDRILVWTDPLSGKAKRIRANGRAAIAPCDARGKTTDPPIDATARVLPASEFAASLKLLRARYRLLKPIVDLWSRVGDVIRRKQHPNEAFIELALDAGATQ